MNDVKDVFQSVQQMADMDAAIRKNAIESLERERDEWKQRALAAEKHLDVIHARFFDLLERPAGL